MPRSGIATQRHPGNSFDALRLVGSMSVLVSHSFGLTGHLQPAIGTITLGAVGVLIFFGISGYLITSSWLREPLPWTYTVKRALRILPGLAAVLLITAFVLGPLVTEISLRSYFLSSGTWTYALENLLMKPANTLPGVFLDNPIPGSVNGSLWTLTHEVQCYALIAILGLIGLLRRRWIAFGVLLLIALTAATVSHPHMIGDPGLLRAFSCGVLIFLWRDKLPLRYSIAIPLLLLTVALSRTWVGSIVVDVSVPYAAVVIAFRSPNFGRRLTRRGDYSYGLYLWAFPIQQTIVSIWPSIGPWRLILVATPLTIAASILSWDLVERRALTVKARFSAAQRTKGLRKSLVGSRSVP